MDSPSTPSLAAADEPPAVAAWRGLGGERARPSVVETLRENRRSAVYRLVGAAADGGDVIARRSSRETAQVERAIYEEVLTGHPFESLRYHGHVDDPEGNQGWILTGDAGGAFYSGATPGHRELAASWLAGLHLCRPEVRTGLPNRGPAPFRRRLGEIRRTIAAGLGNAALARGDRELLERVAGRCDALDDSWPGLSESCEDMPEGVMHGDFVGMNVRVRTRGGQRTLLVFDWEHAGWGVPAIDLAQGPGDVVGPDLATYRDARNRAGENRTPDEIGRWAWCGGIFRALAAIDGHLWVLREPFADDRLPHWLAGSLQAIGDHLDHLEGLLRECPTLPGAASSATAESP